MKLMSTIHLDPTPYTSRMAGFFLYVSNTTSKENGYLCFHDMEGMPREDLRINCSVHGRYVIYYNERINRTYPSYFSRYAYYELCELEVYGEYVIVNVRSESYTYNINETLVLGENLTTFFPIGCSNVGYFGPTCSILWPTNCHESRCDVNTGHCVECLHGYQGMNCGEGNLLYYL